MPSTEPTLRDLGVLGRLGDAEVGELDHALVAAQQVAGLDVAVDDAVAVGVVEPPAGLREDVDRLARVERAVLPEDLRARLPVDVLHDDEVARGLVVEPEVEHLHDVGVHEPRGGQRLAAEARDEARVLRQVLGEQLDGHVALQPRVERELDRRHAADAEAALQAVAVSEELVSHPRPPDRHRRCPEVPPSAPPARRSPRAAGSPSASRSGSRLGRGRRLGGRLGLGRRRGRGLLGLAVVLDPALDLVQPLPEVSLERAVDLARQLRDLVARLAQRGLGRRRSPRPTSARPTSSTDATSWSARSCGISLAVGAAAGGQGQGGGERQPEERGSRQAGY